METRPLGSYSGPPGLPAAALPRDVPTASPDRVELSTPAPEEASEGHSAGSLRAAAMLAFSLLGGLGTGLAAAAADSGYSLASAQVPERPDATATARPGPLLVPRKVRGDYVKHGVNYSQLLSNQEFEDSEAASQAQVQRFFETLGSFLADFESDGKSAAQIVVEAARGYQVNPWVILATLEKENSLVTRESLPRNWVLRTAMGYTVHDGVRHRLSPQSDFLWQVENGTRLLRDLYDEGLELSFPRKLRVDYGSRKIQVDNAATWALLRYTPHTVDVRLGRVGGGNFLFRKHLERFILRNQRELSLPSSNEPG